MVENIGMFKSIRMSNKSLSSKIKYHTKSLSLTKKSTYNELKLLKYYSKYHS